LVVLSDRDIRTHLENGKIRITPTIDLNTQLGSCSVDFRLGTKFRVFEHSRFAYIDLRKGVNVDEIMREVEIGPDESFTLHPGQLVLGMTVESLELAPDLLARLEGRSSLGRLGIIVHGTASVFDPGWIGNPTLELGNVGILPVSLYAGMRICSFTFETLSSPAEVPYTKKMGSKYAHQTGPYASRFAAEKDIKA
jgi:dCTP deaminase